MSDEAQGDERGERAAKRDGAAQASETAQRGGAHARLRPTAADDGLAEDPRTTDLPANELPANELPASERPANELPANDRPVMDRPETRSAEAAAAARPSDAPATTDAPRETIVARAGRTAQSALASGRQAVAAAAQGARAVAKKVRPRFGPRLALARALSLKSRPSAYAAVALAVCGPVLALLTFFAISSGPAVAPYWLQALLALDAVYLIVAIGLIGRQVARLLAARRAQSAGSKLHLRMVAIFAGVAAAPALLLAAFFFLVINLGLEAYFSDQLGGVIRNSRDVARAYAQEHRATLANEAQALANRLGAAADRFMGGVRDSRFGIFFASVTANTTFSDIYLLNSTGEVIARGIDSFAFGFRRPTLGDRIRAENGELVILEDQAANEMRALVAVDGLFDTFLYVTRPVDGQVLASLEATDRGVVLYERLEQNRGVWLVRFAGIYLGFVVLVLLAAIYLGLWFAERLARPIGRLAGAAERVRAGDLTASVKEERGEDELALLSKAFNRMTSEVRRKQEALAEANQRSEEGRLFSEAVLGSVSAGVVALDAEGRIGLVNDAAARLLALQPSTAAGERFLSLAPEFEPLLGDMLAGEERAGVAERPIRVVRDDRERELLARVTRQGAGLSTAAAARSAGAARGFVVTIDDTTDLVQAQRMAAWGDVARRIAHEIKNPLTPIQLAAERLRRKYAERLGDDAESFERYTDTIVRQTGDIGRMVDAFVRFAKMPSPKMAVERLDDIVREAVLLQKEARTHIVYDVSIEEGAGPWTVRADRGQLTQAFTNLLQNAADAIGARLLADQEAAREGPQPEIRVTLTRGPIEDGGPELLRVAIEDNGVGLPLKDRRRLLEPYVTTREKGAGLGLAIVSKIIEEHSGGFALSDARPFAEGARPGAAATVELPPGPTDAARSAGEGPMAGLGAQLERGAEQEPVA